MSMRRIQGTLLVAVFATAFMSVAGACGRSLERDESIKDVEGQSPDERLERDEPLEDIEGQLPDEVPEGDVVGPDLTERCFEMRAHQNMAPGDTEPYRVATGEYYARFYFRAPYDLPMRGVSFEALTVHPIVEQILLLRTELAHMDGAHDQSIGVNDDSALVHVWSRGSDALVLPQEVGMALPAPGGFFVMQVHYYNDTGAPMADQSGLRVCATSRPLEHEADITWLGAEYLTLSPDEDSEFSGTCTPASPPVEGIHILTSMPYMRQFGSKLRTVIHRGETSADETLLDVPYDHRVHPTYETAAVIYPGDTLTTTCSYRATDAYEVQYGISVHQAQCYNFVIAYPAGALSGGSQSLNGTQDTCLF